ncbi:unnamed protein product [Alternaria alternata]
MSAYNTITLTPYEKATFCSVIEHDKLARHCPFDNGRHALELDYTTAPDLGSLSRLPAELMEQVVLELDLASLLVWRRVSKRGTDFVACLIEWKKVTLIAPNTVRMAVGLHSHSTFSLAELYDALHQRTCGISDCSNSAKYISMGTLVRICETCFYPRVWRTIKSFAFNYYCARKVRTSEHTEENEKPLEKEVTAYKVRMDERIGFVEVGVLERRGRGIEGVPGKGINDGDLDRQWAGGSAWE